MERKNLNKCNYEKGEVNCGKEASGNYDSGKKESGTKQLRTWKIFKRTVLERTQKKDKHGTKTDLENEKKERKINITQTVMQQKNLEKDYAEQGKLRRSI